MATSYEIDRTRPKNYLRDSIQNEQLIFLRICLNICLSKYQNEKKNLAEEDAQIKLHPVKKNSQ